MNWVHDEQKKYDLSILKQDLTSQIQTTVYNIKKEQKDIMNDERRQIGKLDNVDMFGADLDRIRTEVNTN